MEANNGAHSTNLGDDRVALVGGITGGLAAAAGAPHAEGTSSSAEAAPGQREQLPGLQDLHADLVHYIVRNDVDVRAFGEWLVRWDWPNVTNEDHKPSLRRTFQLRRTCQQLRAAVDHELLLCLARSSGAGPGFWSSTRAQWMTGVAAVRLGSRRVLHDVLHLHDTDIQAACGGVLAATIGHKTHTATVQLVLKQHSGTVAAMRYTPLLLVLAAHRGDEAAVSGLLHAAPEAASSPMADVQHQLTIRQLTDKRQEKQQDMDRQLTELFADPGAGAVAEFRAAVNRAYIARTDAAAAGQQATSHAPHAQDGAAAAADVSVMALAFDVAAQARHLNVTQSLLTFRARARHPCTLDLTLQHALMIGLLDPNPIGKVELVQELLGAKTSPACRAAVKRTVFVCAAHAGHTTVIKLLMDASHQPAHAEQDHCEALVAAATGGHEDMCKLLLTALADSGCVDVDRYTEALENAALAGNVEICSMLLEARINAARADADKASDLHGALIMAARAGHKAICNMLLKAPNPAKADAHNSQALVEAATGGHMDVCSLLLDYPNNPARADADRNRPLYRAAVAGRKDVCELLLNARNNPASANGLLAKTLGETLTRAGHHEIYWLLTNRPASDK